MLKKMRRRFILAAMAAFLVVILLLLLAVNLWNYGLTIRKQETMIDILLEAGGPGSSFLFSPETQYMTRYFTVYFDPAGQILSISRDHIASVSGEEAAEMALDVLYGNRLSGYEQNYRYRAVVTERGTTILFLNAEKELQSMHGLLLVSAVVALVSAVAVFLLLLLFSKRATAPYARNIEAQKRFITDASHELKTPLTAISTSADILAMEREGDEWVQNIQAQTARLSKLVSGLVTLSRLDEEQPFPERVDFSLSEAAWEIAEPMAALAQAQGKSCSQEIQAGVWMHGDRGAVQQMISILLDNAIKYSDEGGYIRLTLTKKQKKACLQVCNSCAALEPDSLGRLFDRFYRPDASRSQQSGGTGIGLSIAKATAEAHGGKIWAESPDGRSLCITVTL